MVEKRLVKLPVETWRDIADCNALRPNKNPLIFLVWGVKALKWILQHHKQGKKIIAVYDDGDNDENHNEDPEGPEGSDEFVVESFLRAL